MLRIIGSLSAGVFIASVAFLVCDHSATAYAQTYGGSDGGWGQPNPMPGSPIAPLHDAGASPPVTPSTPSNPTPGTPSPSPSPSPNNPGTTPNNPSTPGNPGAPGNPSMPSNPGGSTPGSPSTPGH